MVSRDATTICKYTYSTGFDVKKTSSILLKSSVRCRRIKTLYYIIARLPRELMSLIDCSHHSFITFTVLQSFWAICATSPAAILCDML